MKKIISDIIKQECGQGLIEYAVIISGIALATIASVSALGPMVSRLLANVSNGV